MKNKMLAALASFLLIAVAPASAASLSSAPFGRTRDGKAVTRCTLTARSGVRVSFISYGGTITAIVAPDRLGRPASIVLGFATLREYETKSADGELYFGALLGRTSNWLGQGRFRLDGRTYQVPLSDPPNTIHGGKKGFDKRLWTVTPLAASGPSVSALLTYTSPDGEEGYPGTLKARVTYSLSDEGTLSIHYEATTDKDTVVGLTNHANFNLAGAGSPGGILRQVLTVHAGRYLPLDASQLPLGRLAPVAGTPFDFRSPTAIGARIHAKNAQIAIANGYDNYWVLNKRGDLTQPQLAVHAFDPQSGRTLDCFTTEPGVQIYTAAFLDGSYSGIGGRYGQYSAFTLETQHYPDSPNHPLFPTTELKPGQVYRSTTILHFGVQRQGVRKAGSKESRE